MGKLKLLESCSRGIVSYFSKITFEKAAFMGCFTLGTVFLFMALFGPWKYYLLMTICYISAFMVTEERER